MCLKKQKTEISLQWTSVFSFDRSIDERSAGSISGQICSVGKNLKLKEDVFETRGERNGDEKNRKEW